MEVPGCVILSEFFNLSVPQQLSPNVGIMTLPAFEAWGAEGIWNSATTQKGARYCL